MTTISELTKVMSSKTVYILLSIDENKFPKIVLIVSRIVEVTFE